MEPFLGLMLDLQPRPTQAKLQTVFQNLHKQMTEPIPGLSFNSVEYKKERMDSLKKHLETYDKTKLENAMEKVMKSLASTLSRQRGIQYEFGPEFDE